MSTLIFKKKKLSAFVHYSRPEIAD